MRLPSIPDPRDLAGLLPRAVGLLHGAERLLDDVEALLRRIERTRADADDVIASVATTSARAEVLLDRFEPPLTTLLPVLDRLAETTEPHEVDALVALVDHLPVLSQRVETDVLPVLTTLSSVAPDLHDLLDVSRELNEMLAKLPGMGRIKKRVDRQQEEDAAD